MRIVNLYNLVFIKLFRKIYRISDRLKLPNSITHVFYRIYFKLLQSILDPYLNKSLDSLKQSQYIGTYNHKIIWIFWWQGYEQMPLIVKRCIASIKKHSNRYNVILITKNNMKKYANIPEYIYKKVSQGYITLTHLSDILRFSLLNYHGGLWCDATLYCTSDLSKQYFNYLYTSGGYTHTSPRFAAGRWTGFLMGGNQHNALFQFMCDYFDLYWKYNKYQADYFLIDLGLHYAYVHNIGRFRTYINNVAYYHNPDMFTLAKLLNKPYDKNKFKQMIKKTNMFKLTYKEKFINGDTFYNNIIN